MAPRRMETKPLILCVKTLLLFYSFIFWVTGVVLLSVGLWWRFTLSPYTLLISNAPSNAPFVLTGTGAAIVLFGLFGCFATCRGRPWMLKVYAVFLSLVFLIELIAGISGFIFRHEIKGTFLTTYSEAVLRYDGRGDRSVAVDDVQRRGCYEIVTSFIESNMGIIAGVTFGIAFSQVLELQRTCQVCSVSMESLTKVCMFFSSSARLWPAACLTSSTPTSMRWSETAKLPNIHQVLRCFLSDVADL
ncbi:tetraspanin-7-like isoform X3 [Nerophis lumbriciformis]|uniref:tetraspanin-7-like isoform X3 n=1 Tax=Nerophis lumbriciformis TaxID=546530 RepID=UPI002ADFEE02|nr:tetraspanin-7-like isoform X3 [Nerophis lumbriciformis]